MAPVDCLLAFPRTVWEMQRGKRFLRLLRARTNATHLLVDLAEAPETGWSADLYPVLFALELDTDTRLRQDRALVAREILNETGGRVHANAQEGRANGSRQMNRVM